MPCCHDSPARAWRCLQPTCLNRGCCFHTAELNGREDNDTSDWWLHVRAQSYCFITLWVIDKASRLHRLLMTSIKTFVIYVCAERQYFFFFFWWWVYMCVKKGCTFLFFQFQSNPDVWIWTSTNPELSTNPLYLSCIHMSNLTILTVYYKRHANSILIHLKYTYLQLLL